MPRAKKPAALKSIAGTRRPDRPDPEPTVGDGLEEIPEPPDWLPNAFAQNEFKRLAPVLVANGLLTEATLTAFEQLCALTGKIKHIWSSGNTPSAHLVQQQRALINDFGLTPSAETRKPDGEEEEEKQGNLFAKAEIGKRPK